MLFRPEGLIPSARRARGVPRGRPRRAALRRRARRERRRAGGRLMSARPRRCCGPSAPQGVRRPRRQPRRRLHRAGRIDRQPDRAERRRQDDVLQHAHGRLQADRGPRLLRRGRHDGQAAARVHAARDRADVPEHPALPEHDRARERPRRHAHAPAAATCSRRSCARRASSTRRPTRASARRELLEFCGLRRQRRDDRQATCSYGDQRRLEVARALATEPKLLLLDEPTAGMNPQETAEFTDLRRPAARRARADGADDRARHAGRDGRLRPGHRPRLRREDRRGDAAARSSATSA